MNEEMKSLQENMSVQQRNQIKKSFKIVVYFDIKQIRIHQKIDLKRDWLIKGFQKEKTDYFEIFSFIVRFDIVRTVLSIAAREKLHLRQFHIKTAFLYGIIKTYMRQPEDFEDDTTRVCKLLKSLYGLKQVPRRWSEYFTEFLN